MPSSPRLSRQPAEAGIPAKMAHIKRPSVGPSGMSIEQVGIIVGIAVGFVGILAGTVGVVLGIINYRHQRDVSHPHLRVRPLIRVLVDRDAPPGEGISSDMGIMEIANVGHLPVHGSTIGFSGRKKGGTGFIVIGPQPIDGGSWPREIVPGTVVWLQFKLDSIAEHVESGDARRAFATSIVGDSYESSRRDMKRFREELKNWRQRRAPNRQQPTPSDTPAR